MVFSSDSSDDDVYVSSASRLKALKKKPLVISNDDSPTPKTDDFWSPKTPAPVAEETISQNSDKSSKPNLRSNRSKKVTSTNEKILSTPIVIDDDNDNDDDEVSCTTPKDALNISQDLTAAVEDDNYNVDVKVKWKSRQMIRLELRKYESFEKIFQYFADLEGVSEKQILILKGNKTVHRSDTPASLDLKVLDFLEGGIVHDNAIADEKIEDAGNFCKIKVQMSTKQKINVDLKMNEAFKRVVMTCAEQLGVAPAQIKLSFDGDEIDQTDTPESLDLEQEACIDLRIVK